MLSCQAWPGATLLSACLTECIAQRIEGRTQEVVSSDTFNTPELPSTRVEQDAAQAMRTQKVYPNEGPKVDKWRNEIILKLALHLDQPNKPHKADHFESKKIFDRWKPPSQHLRVTAVLFCFRQRMARPSSVRVSECTPLPMEKSPQSPKQMCFVCS